MLVRFLLRNFCLLGFVVTAFSQEVSIFSVKPYSWSQNVSGVVIAQRIVQDRTQYFQLRLLNGKPTQLSKDNIVRDLTLPVTNYNPLTFSSLNDREMESLESLLSQAPESTEKNILIKALNGVRERKLAAASAANEVKKPTGSMDGAKNMGPIVSKTGKTYSDIESWSLEKGSLKISHRDGVARIPIDEVLEQDYQKFGITPEKLEQLEAELTEIKIQRQAVEQEKLDAQKYQREESLAYENKKAELEKQLQSSSGEVVLTRYDTGIIQVKYQFPWIIDDKAILDSGQIIVSKTNADLFSIEIKNNIGSQHPSINNLFLIHIREIPELIRIYLSAAEIEIGYLTLREKNIEPKIKQSAFRHLIGEINGYEMYYTNGGFGVFNEKQNVGIVVSPSTASLLPKICNALKDQ